MVKVGDKVVVVSIGAGDICFVGDVLVVGSVLNPYGFWAEREDGLKIYARTEEMNGASTVIVRPYAETEAGKRGAKFGTTGVVKNTGKRCVYICDSFVITGNWEIYVEGEANHRHVHPSRIRLDHEPEFVSWKDAPEELKYDASRVYYGGKPVKWIAKPKGSHPPKVVYMMSDGNLNLLSHSLTVKL